MVQLYAFQKVWKILLSSIKAVLFLHVDSIYAEKLLCFLVALMIILLGDIDLGDMKKVNLHL